MAVFCVQRGFYLMKITFKTLKCKHFGHELLQYYIKKIFNILLQINMATVQF